jgi:hypothetical protein
MPSWKVVIVGDWGSTDKVNLRACCSWLLSRCCPHFHSSENAVEMSWSSGHYGVCSNSHGWQSYTEPWYQREAASRRSRHARVKARIHVLGWYARTCCFDSKATYFSRLLEMDLFLCCKLQGCMDVYSAFWYFSYVRLCNSSRDISAVVEEYPAVTRRLVSAAVSMFDSSLWNPVSSVLAQVRIWIQNNVGCPSLFCPFGETHRSWLADISQVIRGFGFGALQPVAASSRSVEAHGILPPLPNCQLLLKQALQPSAPEFKVSALYHSV